MVLVPETSLIDSSSVDPVIREAHRRLNRCIEWESESRRRFLEDLKFAHGDDANGYQWPNAIRHSRDVDQRPTLTMNMTRQHNLQIVNEARKNKSSVKILATGGGASQESADVFKWLIRYIEYNSNAQSAYQVAREFQVFGGIGWWRLVTDYESPDSFDQEIYVRPIPDPLSVYMDPDIRERDGSDAKFAFVFDTVLIDEFRDAYPDIADLIGDEPLGMSSVSGDWVPKDHLWICEYFRKVPKRDKLISFVFEGQRQSIRRSLMPDSVYESLRGDSSTRERDVYDLEVEWKLIAGERVVDETTWLGKYIPLIRCVGEETIIEGIMDRKGHTRGMKDAQRMYNYNAAASVEFGALQTKAPWIAAAKAIENYESMWNTANQINHSVLLFNHLDLESGSEVPIPPPMRPNPPSPAPAFEAGMESAFKQMMMTSGQWYNEMGMMGNERTGTAINARMEQSATSVYHFQDNYGLALRFTGVQLLDLIPKVYDTRRMRRILNDDGESLEVLVDPAARAAYLVQRNHLDQVILRVFNPGVGRYDVAADVGPAQGTKRQETVEMLTLILTQAPALTGIIGDLLLKNMDFDAAQEAAQRLRRLVPPQALGEGPSPNEQQQQTIIAQLQNALTKTMSRAGMDRVKLADKSQNTAIDSYRAETDRIKALAKMLPEDAQGLTRMIEQLVQDTLATHILPLVESASPILGQTNSETAPMPGAQKAPDGNWYLRDPTRMRGFLRVEPLAKERAPSSRVISNA